MVGTQLYIFAQISTYNFMFRPCILATVRFYYKLKYIIQPDTYIQLHVSALYIGHRQVLL